ncbi:MAG: hydrogenase maturation protease [Planctomycetes bacterium]|nr:hydrogenase maturation protease [Planctomycetota bacterium]
MMAKAREPILVLGIGNVLLEDDGVGIELVSRARVAGSHPRIAFVDGGTQGLALLTLLEGRTAILVLDAVRLEATPGTVHHLPEPLTRSTSSADSAHGIGAAELLAAASLLGDLPPRVEIVGIEPASTRTGVGLSPAVRLGMAPALEMVERVLASMLADIAREVPR